MRFETEAERTLTPLPPFWHITPALKSWVTVVGLPTATSQPRLEVVRIEYTSSVAPSSSCPATGA